MKILKNGVNDHLQPELQLPIDPGDKENKTRNILFIVGLIILIVGIVGYFVVRHNPTMFGNNDGGDNDGGFIAAFPIWILFFIPFLVAKKKKEQQKKLNKEELDKEQQKMTKLMVIGLIVAAMFGVFFFLLANK